MVSPELLRRYPYFAGISEESLKQIAMLADEVTVRAGRGCSAKTNRPISCTSSSRGEVSIQFAVGSGELRTADTLAEGDLLVWSALIEPHKTTAIGTVTKDAQLVRIRRRQLRALCEADPCWDTAWRAKWPSSWPAGWRAPGCNWPPSTAACTNLAGPEPDRTGRSRSRPQRAAGRVVRIELVIGRLSGVHPESMRFAFRMLAPGTPLEGAELSIVEVPAQCVCAACGERTAIEELVTACPRCASGDITIEEGRELVLQSIDVEEL